MAVPNKPQRGQKDWDVPLNAALDWLDNKIEEALVDLPEGMVGPTGPTGPAGATGPAGPQGPAGEGSAADIADFVFELREANEEENLNARSTMTIHNHDMRIQTTREDVPEGQEPIDADISINSADDVWITANDEISITSLNSDVNIYAGGGGNQWSFLDAGFRFPDQTIQTTAYTGGDIASHGDFYFDESTLRVNSSNDMILEANEGDSTVAAQIKVGKGDIPIDIAAYRRRESWFYTGDWSTAEWQSYGEGQGQVVLSGITNLETFLSNEFNGEFRSIVINSDYSYPFDGASYGGGNATIYVPEGPVGGFPVTVESLIFIQSQKSGITIDVDDDDFDIISNDMSMTILTTGGNSINIDSSNDLDLQARDDIRFTANTDGTNRRWSMDSEGRFNLPGDGYITNPSQSSGDGNNSDTIHLVPDNDLNSDQYIIIDPTAPNHIHIRAGGEQDASTADLILGAEKTNVQVSDSMGRVLISAKEQLAGYMALNQSTESSQQLVYTYENTNDFPIGSVVNVDGTDFIVDSITVDSPLEGLTTVTASGAVFAAGTVYTFTYVQSENKTWNFINTGEGTLVLPVGSPIIVNPAAPGDITLSAYNGIKLGFADTEGAGLKFPDDTVQTTAYTPGATGTFVSQDGKTVTVTNGIITNIEVS